MQKPVKEWFAQVYQVLDQTCPADISFLENRDPFQYLISVILSAQTTDQRVNQVTPQLFARYPRPSDLAGADLLDVQQIIYTTGFFKTKARHIIDCARAIQDTFHGTVPTEMSDLLSLPGVGRKTANCLRANVLGLPGIVVDTHFSRIIDRIFSLGTRNPQKIESFVSANLAQKNWSRFSMTANLHGRTTCHSQSPACSACPLQYLCATFNT